MPRQASGIFGRFAHARPRVVTSQPSAKANHDLEIADRLHLDPLRQAIGALHLHPVAAVLDIGCGIGLQALQLVEAVRPPTCVIGLDLSHSSLAVAALRGIRRQTLVGEIAAPLGTDQRQAKLALFEMLWGSTLEGASTADHHSYKRICPPGSPDSILDLSAFCTFFTYKLFRCVVKN